MMLPDAYNEYLDRATAMMEYEIYGVTLAVMLLGVLGFLVVSFLLSGPRDRGWIGRFFDLLVVLLSIGLLLACVLGGLYIGNEYDMTGLGAFAGVMLFAGIFYVWFAFRTARKNAADRAKLANYLKHRHAGR